MGTSRLWAGVWNAQVALGWQVPSSAEGTGGVGRGGAQVCQGGGAAPACGRLRSVRHSGTSWRQAERRAVPAGNKGRAVGTILAAFEWPQLCQACGEQSPWRPFWVSRGCPGAHWLDLFLLGGGRGGAGNEDAYRARLKGKRPDPDGSSQSRLPRHLCVLGLHEEFSRRLLRSCAVPGP